VIGGYGKQGLMSGSAELREQAAEGLGELIDVTSEAALKPFVVPITGYVTQTQPELCGHFNITKSLYISLSEWIIMFNDHCHHCHCRPLIRIIGDRFPWQVKSAILGTLGILISKGGIALKPFLPQLQTTFIKCLQDNTRLVIF
jgi:hypothetical protein